MPNRCTSSFSFSARFLKLSNSAAVRSKRSCVSFRRSEVSRALEGLLQLRLQHGDLLRIGGRAAGIGAALRHPSLVVYRGAGRDLRIVGNQVVSSKRGGNIAQRSAPPRGRQGLFFVGPVEGEPDGRGR